MLVIIVFLAGIEGFEPPNTFVVSPIFETGAFGHSAISPNL
jgi:hypothetical protein